MNGIFILQKKAIELQESFEQDKKRDLETRQKEEEKILPRLARRDSDSSQSSLVGPMQEAQIASTASTMKVIKKRPRASSIQVKSIVPDEDQGSRKLSNSII